MSQPPKRVAQILGVVAALAVVGVFISAGRNRGTPEPSVPASASTVALPPMPGCAADVTALLDGLRVGDSVAGWKVQAITAPQDGTVYVYVRQKDSIFAAGVTRKGNSKAPPPIVTESYEIMFGMPQGSPPPQAMSLVADEIATRIRRTEKTVPMPAGL